MSIIRSISGLRATLGDDLTSDLIINYTLAFCQILPAGEIIIGCDGRPSGSWIENIVASTIASTGREAILLGIVPTPTVQLITEKNRSAVGGIAITASHNPAEWNGLKFINSDGVFLDADYNKKLWDALDNKIFPITVPEPPDVLIIDNILDIHIDSILNIPLFQEKNNIELIKKRRFKVAVDAVNSSGSKFIPKLLQELNCEVLELYCENTGVFPHTPEPLPENLTELAEFVKLNNCDLGIAVDPDADRLVLIDERGNPIGEEKTIALATMSVLSNSDYFIHNSKIPSVVVNHSTTRLIEDIALSFGAICHRSPVGEINVVNKMKKTDALIGGEGSGGVILPACHYGRDSLVGTALVLFLLADLNKSLSQICSEFNSYSMIKTKYSFTGEIEDLIKKLENEFSDAQILHEDGIKLIYSNSWVQLRKSNTEPIIRIISESNTSEAAQELISRAKKIIA